MCKQQKRQKMSLFWLHNKKYGLIIDALITAKEKQKWEKTQSIVQSTENAICMRITTVGRATTIFAKKCKCLSKTLFAQQKYYILIFITSSL